jgi:hypothetical protein
MMISIGLFRFDVAVADAGCAGIGGDERSSRREPMPITLEMRRRHDTSARRVSYLCVAVMALWLAWGVLYEATGFPGVDYLSFGLVSLPCGAVLFLASIIASAHGSPEDHAKAAHGYEPLRRIDKLGVTGWSRGDLSVCTSNAARR